MAKRRCNPLADKHEQGHITAFCHVPIVQAERDGLPNRFRYRCPRCGRVQHNLGYRPSLVKTVPCGCYRRLQLLFDNVVTPKPTPPGSRYCVVMDGEWLPSAAGEVVDHYDEHPHRFVVVQLYDPVEWVRSQELVLTNRKERFPFCVVTRTGLLRRQSDLREILGRYRASQLDCDTDGDGTFWRQLTAPVAYDLCNQTILNRIREAADAEVSVQKIAKAYNVPEADVAAVVNDYNRIKELIPCVEKSEVLS